MLRIRKTDRDGDDLDGQRKQSMMAILIGRGRGKSGQGWRQEGGDANDNVAVDCLCTNGHDDDDQDKTHFSHRSSPAAI